eukprot:CAMPEP_0115038482 /NCGR_PEP_ID=MMETSP0216-20121206/43435_1 /TAXON_ID=223996 /ORGANISM="Protocruzia adherens, Strain Boccale" /LENGTH=40 /DNA_ID= /DNA_START= /DNA_END= /DNA_ORIENTATION=
MTREALLAPISVGIRRAFYLSDTLLIGSIIVAKPVVGSFT